MNETFEQVRKELKKYNAEENEVPPKLLVADKTDLLNVDHRKKQNSQFLITIKDLSGVEKTTVEEMLNDLRSGSGQTLLCFFYTTKESIKTVIEDFQDYYNMDLGPDIFQPINKGENASPLLCLIIIVLQNHYYK